MLSIHERFFSIQGEGVHMGRSAFFIRTLGCPVKCPWCDSAGTWHPGFKPAGKNLMDEYDLAEESTAAAHSLEEQSRELNRLIGFFRVGS